MPYRAVASSVGRRRLPTLERVSVKSPCRVPWDQMVRDETGLAGSRFCGVCRKQVYDLSAMSAGDAESFLAEHVESDGARACVRIFRRPDGTVLTSECRTAADARHARRVGVTAAAGAALVIIGGSGLASVFAPTLAVDSTDDAFLRHAEEISLDAVQRDPMFFVDGAVAEIGELAEDKGGR